MAHEENRIRGSLFYCRALTYGYLLRSIRFHRLRRRQTTKSMGLYETRVVEGMPEKISSPRWPARTREVKYLIIRCLKWTPKVRQKTCGVHFTSLSTFIKFESSYNAELALVKLKELFNHSNVAITKRYLSLRQEEILQTYDCLSF